MHSWLALPFVVRRRQLGERQVVTVEVPGVAATLKVLTLTQACRLLLFRGAHPLSHIHSKGRLQNCPGAARPSEAA